MTTAAAKKLVEQLSGLKPEDRDAALAAILGKDDFDGLQTMRERRVEKELKEAVRQRSQTLLGNTENVKGDERFAARYQELMDEAIGIEDTAEAVAEIQLRVEKGLAITDALKKVATDGNEIVAAELAKAGTSDDDSGA